ncbi:hypothetical protein Droror1_Dr00009840 [Drosera rotundifolia]
MWRVIDLLYRPKEEVLAELDKDKVVDFQWNSIDPWTIVSVSDDCASTAGGGTLQMWRVIDLLYRPEEEVLAELDKFKSHILTNLTFAVQRLILTTVTMFLFVGT